MNVLALVPYLYDTAPGQRFRIEPWARYLERRGFRFTFVPFEDEALHEIFYRAGQHGRKAILMIRAFLRRVRVLTRVDRYDVVFLHREAALLGPAVLERWIVRRGIPLVYDFDDPLWIPYRSPTHGWLSRLKCPGKVASICRLATSVIVGNRRLEAYARRYTDRVHVVPSTIDLERYPVKPPSDADPVTLGWTGSHSTLPFLHQIEGPLRRLRESHPFRLLVVADREPTGLDGLRVVFRPWRSATEAPDLHGMDIGLAPFPEGGWNPWRCHGKVLQYMAVGIPPVASPVGIIPTDYIRDGVNGFLAQTEDEWVEKLSLLIRDPGLRHRLGRAARQTVEENFSAARWALRVGEILQEAAETRRPGPTREGGVS
jgi:glycosyltransferase involved in cell wall biosynthesis